VRRQRMSVTGALIMCLVCAEWNVPLFASDDLSTDVSSSLSVVSGASEPASSPVPAIWFGERRDNRKDVWSVPSFVTTGSPSMRHELLTTRSPGGAAGAQFSSNTLNILNDVSSASAERGQYSGRGSRGRRHGALAAIVVGAAASITGAAVLAYANRPDCGTNQSAGGCGYGTKVVGAAVLTGGIVALVAGALAWR
jgi:hypothetical protein